MFLFVLIKKKIEVKVVNVQIIINTRIIVLFIFFTPILVLSCTSITCFIDSCDFLCQIFFCVFYVFKSCTDSVKLL